MNIDSRLESLLFEAKRALAAINSTDRSVAGVIERTANLRYAEGTLVGFVDALMLTDPSAAQSVAPRIEAFISEAIAARMLLD